ncbi:hypothetical protein SUGI_0029810 [Cryptomeria japonica]|uniref:uncharacterized protein LOC131035364 n=1 Tax=Cryptomeria japonica TaxID=3369 RepID=UPI002408EB2F|nr:uncharacterized protein LOC131035364 [Cryptomeria japonica]GLJ05981.1 hypothetical protein SUGI_0029810 [Cryptomeria japonica]
MECKEQEHKFVEHGKKQSEGENCRKRPPAEVENEDEVQEFFAVVDRIHAMHKLYKQGPMNSPSGGETPTSQITGGDVIHGKSLWKPSLEWEDFSALAGKESSFSDCSNNTSTSVVCEKPCIGRDQKMGVRSFDLNVEATVEE